MAKSEYEPTEKTNNFFVHVYSLMTLGLSVTGFVAYAIYSVPALFKLFLGNPFVLILLFFVQIGLVMGISLKGLSLPWKQSFALFLIYATTVGITSSALFIVYPLAVIYKAFFVCAVMFGVMATYGYFTRSDLSGIGAISSLALVGLIAALLINIFFASTMADFIISIIGVILFSLLTAYDTQKLKKMSEQLDSHNGTLTKIAVLGALTLYLDFLNLFFFLLRFTGSRRD